MPEYLAPGVYIDKTAHLPPSINASSTCIAAFVGYTQQHQNNGRSLLNKPVRITSLLEFEQYFGGDAKHQFNLTPVKAGQLTDASIGNKGYCLSQHSTNFLLYRSLSLFFNNGGSECFIVSVGDYKSTINASSIITGLSAITNETNISLIAIPDAVALASASECASVQQALLARSSQGVDKHFAILDIFQGNSEFSHTRPDNCIEAFRHHISGADLSYAAAYYPWLDTIAINRKNLGFGCFYNIASLKRLLLMELAENYRAANRTAITKQKQLQSIIDAIAEEDLASLNNAQRNEQQQLHQTLLNLSPLYSAMMTRISEKLNLLPPSGAICGCYALVDRTQGVWKAPANIALSSVIRPCTTLTAEQQQALNIHPSGKSVNVIRSFVGQGVVVWGARTLAGNDAQWRYINVKRTAMMIEQSIRYGLKALIFEPNEHNLWSTIKMMIENFLAQLWQQGALAGAKPQQAYFVNVGLNSTMTATDVANGRLIVELGVAIIKPAEFILLKVEQQNQPT
ncbi:phage tail sheath family protein [Neptunicella sp. SCSIO 80796]|uniref:phage tail sheath family protein n=1 Tax=Neptunicella plasticusilytica TaxID=3117012 RepID=UPI003A4D3BF2